MKRLFSTILFCAVAISVAAQFAPPAGQAGSTAIHKDSSIIVGWANHATMQRGYRDISDPSLGLVTFGDSLALVNKADAQGVASLGDGGSATLTFPTPIVNGPGPDFAVFENAFVDTFLELAFVEVSSDGINFHRFPATSNTQDTVQVGSFGALDATQIHNLAGKYIVNYGTPFDLEELKNINGLDVNHVTHVRVIDVVGCIADSFARYDKNNKAINDPWRTDFITGGFDLDAVAVINTWATAISEVAQNDFDFSIYPNPSYDGKVLISFNSEINSDAQVELMDLHGRTIYRETIAFSKGKNDFFIQPSLVQSGNFYLRISSSVLEKTAILTFK